MCIDLYWIIHFFFDFLDNYFIIFSISPNLGCKVVSELLISLLEILVILNYPKN